MIQFDGLSLNGYRLMRYLSCSKCIYCTTLHNVTDAVAFLFVRQNAVPKTLSHANLINAETQTSRIVTSNNTANSSAYHSANDAAIDTPGSGYQSASERGEVDNSGEMERR